MKKIQQWLKSEGSYSVFSFPQGLKDERFHCGNGFGNSFIKSGNKTIIRPC